MTPSRDQPAGDWLGAFPGRIAKPGAPLDFTDGVAVITGAASGLGAGLVQQAAAMRMRIVLADIDARAIESAARDLRARGLEAIAQVTDVRDPVELDRLAAVTTDAFDTVTLLINNAGVELLGPAWEQTVEEWNRVIDVNLNGVFYGLRAFLPGMLRADVAARVVNVSSVAALRFNPGSASYAASKHAVLALSESVAEEVAERTANVKVSAVVPGPIRTAIFARAATVGDGTGELTRRRYADALARNGMDPHEAARIVFDGASRGLVRIHTHPEASRALIDARHAELSD